MATCIADQTSYIPPLATNPPPQVGQLQLMRPDHDDDNNHIFDFHIYDIALALSCSSITEHVYCLIVH